MPSDSDTGPQDAVDAAREAGTEPVLRRALLAAAAAVDAAAAAVARRPARRAGRADADAEEPGTRPCSPHPPPVHEL
jgi:hypothetical protein